MTFRQKFPPFVEYSNLQFPNDVIICNNHVSASYLIVVILDTVCFHLTLLLSTRDTNGGRGGGGVVSHFQILLSDAGASPTEHYFHQNSCKGRLAYLKALLQTFSGWSRQTCKILPPH